jgi:thymidylate kinase
LRAFLRRPRQALVAGWSVTSRRLGKLFRPEGLGLLLLGPDGVGKSTMIRFADKMLRNFFYRSKVVSFPPGLLSRLFRRSAPDCTLPHATPPRPFLLSILRAVLYWLPYHCFTYPAGRVAHARNTLILYDRHLIDALVDPKRYRYGGPAWLLRGICRLISKPDLIMVLDAAPHVVQSRKQEVPLEETARQRDGYLSLGRAFKNFHVINAQLPEGYVIEQINDAVVRHLSNRVARRLNLQSMGALNSPSKTADLEVRSSKGSLSLPRDECLLP